MADTHLRPILLRTLQLRHHTLQLLMLPLPRCNPIRIRRHRRRSDAVAAFCSVVHRLSVRCRANRTHRLRTVQHLMHRTLQHRMHRTRPPLMHHHRISVHRHHHTDRRLVPMVTMTNRSMHTITRCKTVCMRATTLFNQYIKIPPTISLLSRFTVVNLFDILICSKMKTLITVYITNLTAMSVI